jgi:hypothetical protein
MSSAPPAKPVATWLFESAQASTPSWASKLKQLLALQSDWEAALQHLKLTRLSSARVAMLDDSRLTISTASAASRAKLQLLEVELLYQLQARGWQVSAIDYHIQGRPDSSVPLGGSRGNDANGNSGAVAATVTKKAGAHMAPERFNKALEELKAHAATVRANTAARALKKPVKDRE